MKYIVDIDGTICTQTSNGEYGKAIPYESRIEHINELFEKGHEIHYWTARGMSSDKDYEDLTRRQMKEWGVKYTTLSFKKPSYDYWIDDKAFNSSDYFGVEL